jgi:hypothetical protein
MKLSEFFLNVFPGSELLDEEQAQVSLDRERWARAEADCPQQVATWRKWNHSRPPLDLSKVRTVEKEKRLARKRARKAA